MFRSLYQHRGFVWRHALADFRHRYAGTGMGVLWNIVHPLAMIAIYGVVFVGLMGANLPDVPGRFGFLLFLCGGFFTWIGFSEALSRATTSLSGNAAYLRKLPIPEHVFVAQAAMSATITLAVGFALLIVVALVLGLPPHWTWLLLPLPMVLLQACGFGLGMIVGTLNVFFRDVSQFLTIALSMLFWLAPIIYPRTSLKQEWLRQVMVFHPVTPAVEAVRELFLWHRVPEAWMWRAMVAWGILSLLAGWFVLRSLRDEIRDVV